MRFVCVGPVKNKRSFSVSVYLKSIHPPFQGLGTDEDTLIEVMASRNNREIMEIKKVYKEGACQQALSNYFQCVETEVIQHGTVENDILWDIREYLFKPDFHISNIM